MNGALYFALHGRLFSPPYWYSYSISLIVCISFSKRAYSSMEIIILGLHDCLLATEHWYQKSSDTIPFIIGGQALPLARTTSSTAKIIISADLAMEWGTFSAGSYFLLHSFWAICYIILSHLHREITMEELFSVIFSFKMRVLQNMGPNIIPQRPFSSVSLLIWVRADLSIMH